jgi:hypothetical protein
MEGQPDFHEMCEAQKLEGGSCGTTLRLELSQYTALLAAVEYDPLVFHFPATRFERAPAHKSVRGCGPTNWSAWQDTASPLSGRAGDAELFHAELEG